MEPSLLCLPGIRILGTVRKKGYQITVGIMKNAGE